MGLKAFRGGLPWGSVRGPRGLSEGPESLSEGPEDLPGGCRAYQRDGGMDVWTDG